MFFSYLAYSILVLCLFISVTFSDFFAEVLVIPFLTVLFAVTALYFPAFWLESPVDVS